MQKKYREGLWVLWLIECASPRLTGCRLHQQHDPGICGISPFTNLILALVYFRLTTLSALGYLSRSVQGSTADGSFFILNDVGIVLPKYVEYSHLH